MPELNPVTDWHAIAVEMLMTDADLALLSIVSLFADDDKGAVARVVGNSRNVYDAIIDKRKRVTLSASEAAALNDKMDRLRARLKFLGEPVYRREPSDTLWAQDRRRQT